MNSKKTPEESTKGRTVRAPQRPRHNVDWERIEPHWRANLLSVLQIAAEYEKETGNAISHTAINKHFRNLGVPRDLQARIQAKADAILAAHQVSREVSVETRIADAKMIDAGALVVAQVQLTQRRDIIRSRNLTAKLMDELEAMTDNKDLYDSLGEFLHAPDDKGQDKRNELYNKVISLSGRIANMKLLMDTMKTGIALERENWSIGAKETPNEVPTTYTMHF
jgi:hypothetical protein